MQALRSLVYAGDLLSGDTAVRTRRHRRDSDRDRAHTGASSTRWADFHRWLARAVLGIRSEFEGSIPEGAVLIAVKHGSMYETLEALRIARTPVVVLKHELSSLPLFGWLTRRYGVIPVDRGAGAKALREMMELGRQAVANGRPVIIFPEGTRVPAGSTPPLGSGFAGLYRALGLPVVPVAVDSARLWGRGLIKRSGTIHFQGRRDDPRRGSSATRSRRGCTPRSTRSNSAAQLRAELFGGGDDPASRSPQFPHR